MKVIRMAAWALVSALFLLAALTVPLWYPAGWPEAEKVQVILYKTALVTGFAYTGYWCSRHAFVYAVTEPPPYLSIAVVMAACILAGAMAL